MRICGHKERPMIDQKLDQEINLPHSRICQALGDLDVLPGMSLENWGMSARYRSMGRGVIDTRDVLYFLSVAFVFLYLTKLKFEQK